MSARGSIAIAAATFLMVAGLACKKEEPPPPPAEPAAPPAPKAMTADERVKWYQDCWNLFNNKNWDAFKACYADEAVTDDVDSGRPTLTGAEAIVASSRDNAAGFPDMKGTPQLILANGNRIAALYLMTGTNSGEFKGPDGKPIPATNKKYGFMFAHVIDTNDAGGKATNERGYSDAGTLWYQLGLSKAPAREMMDTGVATPTIVTANNLETETKNVQAFAESVEKFNAHDVKAVASFNAPDVVYHDYTQPHDVSAKDNDKMLSGFFKAFPDCKLTLTSSWGAGDYVVSEGTFEGTNNGPFPAMGIKKATGKPVKVRYVEIARYDGGKVKEDWLLFNTAAFGTQLGMMGQ